jgi:tetratricopeptide (TPR) repeat protein
MAAGARSGFGSRAALALAVAALAIGLYLPAASFDFVSYDDWKRVRDNPDVRAGLTAESLRRTLAPGYYRGHESWIPLTTLSYLVDAELFGIDPRGFHATNVVLHATATALCFLAFARLTRRAWPSALAAALFAVHPLHVEPVAWIASRKDVLSGALFFLALWLYAGYAERPSVQRMLAVLAAAAAGLLAKPVLMALPVVLLLLDAWPLGRLSGRSWRARAALLAEKLPLFALATAIGVMTFAVQPVVGVGGHSLEVRAANAIDSLGSYLLDAVWPRGLAAFYPHPGVALSGGRVAASAFALSLASLVCLASFRRRPWLTVGWLWFLALLAPVIGLAEIGLQARADRYMYLPLAGLAWLFACEAAELARRGVAQRRAAIALCAALLILFAAASRAQLESWRDSERMYRRAIAVTSGNYLAHYGLAGVLAEQGRLDEAHAELLEATRANPTWTLAWERIAELELARGRPEAALDSYARLLAIRPEDAPLHLGAGAAALRAGRDAEALRHYRESARLAGGWREPAHQLAWLLATHPDPALRDPAEALRLTAELVATSRAPDPALLDALAAAHAARGELARAAELADEAAALAMRAGDTALAGAIADRRDRYRQGRAYVATRPLAPHAPLADAGAAPLR